MAEVVYAVHTRTCSYLLDEDGVCRWIISPTGMVPADVRRCVGAQFVACLDASEPGGLVGELILGAAGLFVKQDLVTGRMILLRTSRIEHVEFRGPAAVPGPSDGSRATLPPPPPPTTIRNAPPDTTRMVPGLPPPPPRLSKSTTFDDSFLDPDELVQYDAETTVTLTMPLFRPHLAGRSRADVGSADKSVTVVGPPPSSESSMATLRTAPRAPPSKRRGRGRGPAADK